MRDMICYWRLGRVAFSMKYKNNGHTLGQLICMMLEICKVMQKKLYFGAHSLCVFKMVMKETLVLFSQCIFKAYISCTDTTIIEYRVVRILDPSQ